ncbi:MAG: hypothetical protein Fur0021_39460 [Candidatus Promineifilaceae bacterium]
MAGRVGAVVIKAVTRGVGGEAKVGAGSGVETGGGTAQATSALSVRQSRQKYGSFGFM